MLGLTFTGLSASAIAAAAARKSPPVRTVEVFPVRYPVTSYFRYFTKPEQVALLTGLGLADGRRRPLPDVGQLTQEATEAAKQKGRSARFSVQVVSSYRFTCALTGLCCLTSDGAAIVDAAHIEP